MVLGVPRDVHAVASALFALVRHTHGRSLSRLSFSELGARDQFSAELSPSTPDASEGIWNVKQGFKLRM